MRTITNLICKQPSVLLFVLVLCLSSCKKDPLNIMYGKKGIWKVYMSVDYKDKNTGELTGQTKDTFLIDFTSKSKGRVIIKDQPDSSIPFTWEKGTESSLGLGKSNHWIRISSLYYCNQDLFYITDHDRDRETWTASNYPWFSSTNMFYSAEVVKQ